MRTGTQGAHTVRWRVVAANLAKPRTGEFTVEVVDELVDEPPLATMAALQSHLVELGLAEPEEDAGEDE